MDRLLNQRTYENLKKDIMTFGLMPGEPVSAAKIARRYRVSRTPAREALVMLQGEGLVDIFPQSRSVISKINVRRIRQEWFVRRTLELAMVDEFFESVKKEDIEEMKHYAKLLEAVKKVGDMIEKEQDNVRLMERYEKEMEENILQEKHKLWGALASNRLSTIELLEKGQHLGMDFTASAYLVFLFKLMQEGDATGCSDELNRASEKVNSLSSTWEKVLSFDRSPEGWAFLIKGESETEVLETFAETKKELLNLVAAYPKVEYFGGLGSIVQRIGDIQNSYKEAARAFSSRFFLDANQIADSAEMVSVQNEEDGKIDVSKMLSKKREHELVEKFFKNGTVEEVDSFLDELFQNIGEQNCKSLL